MEYNDYELVYMINEDEEALSYLVKKYEPLFKKLSYSFVQKYKYKGIDPEDIIQHCRIALCNIIDKYDSSRNVLFYTYLLVCIKGVISNYTRRFLDKSNCYNYMDIEEYENLDSFIINYDAYDNYVLYELQAKIIDFKNNLCNSHSQVFELWYNNFSYKEIAILLGIKEKRVDNILLSVRKKLEKYFLFS